MNLARQIRNLAELQDVSGGVGVEHDGKTLVYHHDSGTFGFDGYATSQIDALLAQRVPLAARNTNGGFLGIEEDGSVEVSAIEVPTGDPSDFANVTESNGALAWDGEHLIVFDGVTLGGKLKLSSPELVADMTISVTQSFASLTNTATDRINWDVRALSNATWDATQRGLVVGKSGLYLLRVVLGINTSGTMSEANMFVFFRRSTTNTTIGSLNTITPVTDVAAGTSRAIASLTRVMSFQANDSIRVSVNGNLEEADGQIDVIQPTLPPYATRFQLVRL